MAVLDELFNGDETTEQILQRKRISISLYRRWHSEPAFADEFEKRVEQLNRHSRLLIAKYSSLAAAKLISLTDSTNPETARKTCLDIISLTKTSQAREDEKPDSQQEPETGHITPELAEKILESLAQGRTADSI
jgi:hypothetical protein